jgi:16S rRNA (uracil1498-N3)-methyltransferase
MATDLPRFYCTNLEADRLELAGDEAHHALDVLRLRAGARVELFDGRGTVAAATIEQATRKTLLLSVQDRRAVVREVPLIRLAFAAPKGRRLDWLVEKATELGAAALWPVAFERSVAGREELGEHKRQRWLGQCVAAAKQCGLDLLPQIRDTLGLDEYLRQRLVGEQAGPGAAPAAGGSPRGCGLLGDLDESALSVPAAMEPWRLRCHARCHASASGSMSTASEGPALATARCHASAGGSMPTVGGGPAPATAIDILVGPEGGLTDAERSAAIAAGLTPVRIGRTTLRVETAAIALLSAVMAWAR